MIRENSKINSSLLKARNIIFYKGILLSRIFELFILMRMKMKVSLYI